MAFVLQGPRQMGVISATAHYECVFGMREPPSHLHFFIQGLTDVGPHPMTIYSDIKWFLSHKPPNIIVIKQWTILVLVIMIYFGGKKKC